MRRFQFLGSLSDLLLEFCLSPHEPAHAPPKGQPQAPQQGGAVTPLGCTAPPPRRQDRQIQIHALRAPAQGDILGKDFQMMLTCGQLVEAYPAAVGLDPRLPCAIQAVANDRRVAVGESLQLPLDLQRLARPWHAHGVVRTPASVALSHLFQRERHRSGLEQGRSVVDATDAAARSHPDPADRIFMERISVRVAPHQPVAVVEAAPVPLHRPHDEPVVRADPESVGMIDQQRDGAAISECRRGHLSGMPRRRIVLELPETAVGRRQPDSRLCTGQGHHRLLGEALDDGFDDRSRTQPLQQALVGRHPYRIAARIRAHGTDVDGGIDQGERDPVNRRRCRRGAAHLEESRAGTHQQPVIRHADQTVDQRRCFADIGPRRRAQFLSKPQHMSAERGGP